MAYIAPLVVQAAPAIPGNIQAGGIGVDTKPPFIPANGCAKVEIRGLQDGDIMETIIYVYQSSGNFTLAQLTSLASAVTTAFEAIMIPIMSVDYALSSVRCSDMSSRTGPVAEEAVEPNIPGTRSGVSAPTTLVVGVGTHTGFKGRSNNGRWFWGGCLVTDFLDSLPTDTARTLYLDTTYTFISSLISEGYTIVLISYQTNRLWRTVAQVTTLFSISAGTFIYTMRRRLPGHNRHR